jgi:hypothetical protein
MTPLQVNWLSATREREIRCPRWKKVDKADLPAGERVGFQSCSQACFTDARKQQKILDCIGPLSKE